VLEAKMRYFSVIGGAAVFAASQLASAFPSIKSNHLYIGLANGYGSTNWAKIKTSNAFLSSSMPVGTHDGGYMWGVYFGDKLSRTLNFRLQYQRFSRTKVSFANFNEYDPPEGKAFSMYSKTQNVELLNRFTLPVS
jgi:hypothetical protein